MDIVFYMALFLTAVFVLPWMFLYGVPLILAVGAAGWGVMGMFQELMVPEKNPKDIKNGISPLNRFDLFPYRNARQELKRIILVNRTRRARPEKKVATAS